MASVDLHDWIDVPKGSLLTGGVPFRFCCTCNREEWGNGAVRLGDDESQCVFDTEETGMLEPDNRPEKRVEGGLLTGIASGLIILLVAAIVFGFLTWAAVSVWSAVLGAGGC